MSYQQTSVDPQFIHALKPPSKAPWVLTFLILIGAGAGGAYLWSEMGKTKAAIAEATARATAAEAKRAEVAPTIEKLEAEKAELVTAKAELERSVEAKTGELEQLKGTAEKLQTQMKEEIAKGDIRLSESGGKLRVDLVDKILFDSGDATISKRGEGVLAKVGAVLAQIDDKQIQVSGHTDNVQPSEKLTATFPTNWELSTARAVTVVRFLGEKASVPARRMVATGYGEWNPIASNKTPSGRARNRRIEILLTPALAPKTMGRAKVAELAKADTKEEGKAEAKAEAKPVAKAEAKPVTKTVAKTDTKPAAQKTTAHSKRKK